MSASPNSLIGAHPAGIDQPRRLFHEGTPLFAPFFISNPEDTQLFLQHLHPILDDEGPMLETLVDYPLEPLSSQKPLQMSWVGGGLYSPSKDLCKTTQAVLETLARNWKNQPW